MLLPNKKDTALKTRFGTLFGAQGGPRSFLDAAGRITASQRCFLMSQNRSGNDSGTPFEARVRSQGPSQRRGVTSLRATSVPRARGKFHVCRVLAFPRRGGWRQGVQKVFLHALALSSPCRGRAGPCRGEDGVPKLSGRVAPPRRVLEGRGKVGGDAVAWPSWAVLPEQPGVAGSSRDTPGVAGSSRDMPGAAGSRPLARSAHRSAAHSAES